VCRVAERSIVRLFSVAKINVLGFSGRILDWPEFGLRFHELIAVQALVGTVAERLQREIRHDFRMWERKGLQQARTTTCSEQTKPYSTNERFFSIASTESSDGYRIDSSAFSAKWLTRWLLTSEVVSSNLLTTDIFLPPLFESSETHSGT